MKYVNILSLFFLIYSCSDTKKSKQIEQQKQFKYEAQIDELANTFLLDSVMNSLSIGVSHKGEEFIKHYGELDPGMNNKPTNKTIYDIASVTKTFVGTLIAEAELEGKLSIEDDIRKYLDGDYSNLQYENEPIKVKHLITHSSGLPQWLPLRISDEFNKKNTELDLSTRVSNIEKKYSKKEFLEDLKEVKIDTIPGFKYNYSGVGSELASYILEQIYKSPLEKVIQDRICKKANMTSTMITVPKSKKQFYANGYGKHKNLKPHMITNLWGGSGYGKSTPADLLNYIKFQLDKVNPAVQKSHAILFDKDVIHGDPRNKMGYMWMISTDRDFGPVLEHHGGAHGTQNWLLIYPEEELGITIITNESDRNTGGKLLNVAYGLLEEIAKDKE